MQFRLIVVGKVIFYWSVGGESHKGFSMDSGALLGTEGTESHNPSVSPNSRPWKYPCLVDEFKVTRMAES
jgi:hypothetical protein